MDIAVVKAVERKIEIKHPKTGDNLGINVTLMSMDDNRMKVIKREITNRRLELEQRGKRFQAKELEGNANNIAFKSMISWEWTGETTFHDKKPAFNHASVIEVFTELPWFRDQITEALGDEKSFYLASN